MMGAFGGSAIASALYGDRTRLIFVCLVGWLVGWLGLVGWLLLILLIFSFWFLFTISSHPQSCTISH